MEKEKFEINKNGNWEYTFVSDICIDNGYVNKGIGKYECTMELFTDDNGTPTMIEWDIPEMEHTEHIGLEFSGIHLEGYDGVFELPSQAVQLIKKAGYKVGDDFLED